MKTLTAKQRQQIESSVDELVDAFELEDKEFHAAAKEQMLKDCIDLLGQEKYTFDEVITANKNGAHGVRVARMMGVNSEGILRKMAAKHGVI